MSNNRPPGNTPIENLSKKQLIGFIGHYQGVVEANDDLINKQQKEISELKEELKTTQANLVRESNFSNTLQQDIKSLTKPKGDGSHRCHLCHTWVNPDELYEVKADACETCMQVQLSENRRHAENQIPDGWYRNKVTPETPDTSQTTFHVNLGYHFTWEERAVGSWEGTVAYCQVRLPYVLYIGAQFESDEPDRQCMLIKTDGKQSAGRQIIDELSIEGVSAAQNYLQSRVIIDHQESKFD